MSLVQLGKLNRLNRLDTWAHLLSCSRGSANCHRTHRLDELL
jgi:hypothetical protein